MSHCIMVDKPIPTQTVMKIPEAKAAVEEELTKLQKLTAWTNNHSVIFFQKKISSENFQNSKLNFGFWKFVLKNFFHVTVQNFDLKNFKFGCSGHFFRASFVCSLMPQTSPGPSAGPPSADFPLRWIPYAGSPLRWTPPSAGPLRQTPLPRRPRQPRRPGRSPRAETQMRTMLPRTARTQTTSQPDPPSPRPRNHICTNFQRDFFKNFEKRS